MHSLLAASVQPASVRLRFAGSAGVDRPAAVRTACEATRVVDLASYQALLADLGLTPDPRLCVPAVKH